LQPEEQHIILEQSTLSLRYFLLLECNQSKPLWIKLKSQQGGRKEMEKPLSTQILQEGLA